MQEGNHDIVDEFSSFKKKKKSTLNVYALPFTVTSCE